MMLPTLLRDRPFPGTRQTVPMDYQHGVERPVRTDPDGVTPCVVLLTTAADRESDELSARLEAERIPVLRLDAAAVAGTDLAYDPDQHVLRVGADRYRPRVVWLRSAPAGAGGGVPRFAELVQALLADQRVHVINGVATVESPDRANQLVAAAAVGLRAPITVVTTNPADAVERIPGDADVIIKSLDADVLDAAPRSLPRRRSRAEVLAEQETVAEPVIVQEFVTATRELRIVLVGGTFYAYASSTNGMTARTVMPPALRAPLAALAARWGLDAAAFDLLDTAAGPVFLEVNVVFDWMWHEQRVPTTPVSSAVAGMMIAAFHAP